MVGERLWHQLLDAGSRRQFRPRDLLLRQGDRGDHLLLLTGGRVRVVLMDAEGGELLLALRSPGDVVGEMARIGNVRTATVQAVDRCSAVHLPADIFDSTLRRHGAQGVLSDYLVSKLSETVPYQHRLVHFQPRQKIARMILDVVTLAGPELSDPLRVPLSLEGLAASLGLARSTVAAHVAGLRKAGVLRAGPRLAVADLALLRREVGQPTH